MDFPAAHHLEGYPGDCARVHGHNWGVEVFAKSRTLDSIGIAVDFRTLKVALQEVISPWDHQDLNTLPDFQQTPPTAECIAKLVYEKLQRHFPKTGSTWIDRVTIWENERYSATYYED